MTCVVLSFPSSDTSKPSLPAALEEPPTYCASRLCRLLDRRNVETSGRLTSFQVQSFPILAGVSPVVSVNL